MAGKPEFEENGGVLLKYNGKGGDVVIPDGVKAIEGQWTMPAFDKSKNVASITLPASMKTLDPNQFYYLKTLKWIECKGEVTIENDNCVFPGCKALDYVICNPNTPLSKMPQKWKQWLAIGVMKYIFDGNAVAEEAREEVVAYVKGQNKKLGLYKLGYTYLFVAEFMSKEGLLTEEQYDEMISYAQEKGLKDLTSMLMGGRVRQYPPETLPEREEKKADQEIAHAVKMEDHTSTEYLKSQWTWKKREDGTLIIWTYKGTDSEVFIPAMVGKNKVTAIRGQLFESNTAERNEWLRHNITRIHLAEGITEIGDPMYKGPIAAFVKPTNLYLPRSLTKICRNAFASRYAIIEEARWDMHIVNVIIHAPAGSYAEQYAKENGIPFIQVGEDGAPLIPNDCEQIPEAAFTDDRTLAEFKVPAHVKSIGKNAFSGCSGLTKMSIPDNVSSIDSGAFSGCENLVSVTLPKTLSIISYNLFMDCKSLASIAIPHGVQTIESGAFQNCTSLKSISLPDGVAIIESAAFYGCSNLQNISIPNSVNKIQPWAFKDCPKLTIHAPAGSCAEQYAKKNNIPFAAE